MDYINFQEVLGMTDQQVLEEIQTMREMEKYIISQVGQDQYDEWCMGYSKERVSKELRENFGATEQEIQEACNFAEASMRDSEESKS